MSRSASGLDTPRSDDWRLQGRCRDTPDAWFEAKTRTEAMHICRTHCPVAEQCLLDALECPPKDGVQGGVAFNNERRPYPDWYWVPTKTCQACRPSDLRDPPTDTGACGTYAGYRRHLRRREDGCDPCRAAAVRRQQEQARRKLSTAGDGPVGERTRARKKTEEA